MMPIPPNHQAVMTYLMLDNPNEFINFVEKVFDAMISAKHESPEGIRHCEATIGGSTIMFAGTTADWPAQTTNLFVYVEDVDSTYTNALANGATSIMGLSDQDYGRTCGIKDPCGNVWWMTTIMDKE
jgi:PhnB protein